MPAQVHNPMRKALLVVLLLIAAGVVVDTSRFAAQGPVIALRTQPLGTAEAGSVDAFCGFAPCGMPLECN